MGRVPVIRTLDYVARLDERNRAHRLTAADPSLMMKARWWSPGYPVLDQGQEGACVGFGCTGEAMASPARVKPWMTDTGLPLSEAPIRAAQKVYRRAKEIDEWEGVDYEGTSVRAGMLVGRERGWWTGFRWAFSMLELRAALEEGPVVIGVEWFDSMYETGPFGDVTVSGPSVGGHCLVITGYSPNYRGRGPRYRWRNSWGSEYGVHGNGYIRPELLDRVLFKAGGEAAVAIGRSA